MNILKVLEPYDNNMKVLTKKELTSADFGSLGFGLKDPVEVNIARVGSAKKNSIPSICTGSCSFL